MTQLSPFLSLIKELNDIYQVLISKECFPLALKVLELKAKLVNRSPQWDMPLSDLISQLSDKELERMALRFSKPKKSNQHKDK